ncbi:MAG: N-acyl homoserine lactonase family protein [Flavobacteriaceae bacterium]
MRTLALLIAILMLSACKEAPKPIAQVNPATSELKKSPLKLYTFDGGTVMVNALGYFAQDDIYKGKSKEFANAFYVIQHPDGNLMWDAGLPESLVGMDQPFTTPDGAFTVSRKDSLHNQLTRIGLTTEDFKYIVLSHTHFDHVGHAAALKSATWLVQEEEYKWVTGDEVRKQYPDNYNAIKDLNKIEIIKGDHDIFGDGTVILKYMPGHTPGHQVLFLDLKEHGPLLLSGDLYHFSENREFKRIPIFNYDLEQTRKSMSLFEAFAEEKNAKVYLQHQKEDFLSMPKAPEYLK